MSNYVKLVNFEVHRFLKIFVALIVMVIVAQIIGAFIDAKSYIVDVETTIKQQNITIEQYLIDYSGYSIKHFLNTGFFVFSVMFAATVLIIYVAFIWYRDWLGKSSFIYRLLMLPTERLNVYFAKLTTIVLFLFCLLGVEVVLLEVIDRITQVIVPSELLVDSFKQAVYSSEVLAILYPETVLQFLVNYGVGIAIVVVIFTVILLERSLHLKGMFLAAIYAIVSVALLLTPIIINSYTNYFFYNELLWLTISACVIVIAVAIGLANYLLKRKINV